MLGAEPATTGSQNKIRFRAQAPKIAVRILLESHAVYEGNVLFLSVPLIRTCNLVRRGVKHATDLENGAGGTETNKIDDRSKDQGNGETTE